MPDYSRHLAKIATSIAALEAERDALREALASVAASMRAMLPGAEARLGGACPGFRAELRIADALLAKAPERGKGGDNAPEAHERTRNNLGNVVVERNALREVVRAADAVASAVVTWMDYDHENNPDCIGQPTVPVTVCPWCNGEGREGGTMPHSNECPIPVYTAARAKIALPGDGA